MTFNEPSKTPSFYIFLLLNIFFISFQPIDAEEYFLSLIQEASFPGRYDATISAKTPKVNGAIYLRSSEYLPDPEDLPEQLENPFSNLEVRSWSINAQPIKAVSVTCGALALTGLPARAKNPFFSLKGPFYTPLLPNNDAIIRRGNSLDTGNIALECSPGTWKFALAGDPEAKLDKTTWFLLSRVFKTSTQRESSLSISIIGSARTLPEKETDSWFMDTTATPRSVLYVPGTEVIFSGKHLSASATAFSSLGALRTPAYLLRADGSLSLGILSIAAGYASSNRTFLPMDGVPESCLRRIFAVPALTFSRGWLKKGYSPPIGARSSSFVLKLSAIVIGDVLRAEKYYEQDTTLRSTGLGIALANSNISFSANLIRKGEETSVAGKFAASGPRKIPLFFETDAKSTIIPEADGNYGFSDIVAHSGFVWKPTLYSSKKTGHKRKGSLECGIEGSFERPESDTAPIYGLSTRLGLAVSSRHVMWKFSSEFLVSDGKNPYAARLSFQTTLR